MYQSQVRLVYAIPGAALGTCPHPTITDQITDQNTPYCGELAYAVCNDIRVLAVIRCISREPNPLHPHHYPLVDRRYLQLFLSKVNFCRVL